MKEQNKVSKATAPQYAYPALFKQLDAIKARLDALETRKPSRKQQTGEALEISADTLRQFTSNAQWLNMRDANQLAEIVLKAFNDMVDEEGWITFPLMLQQVEKV